MSGTGPRALGVSAQRLQRSGSLSAILRRRA